jgi:hypothetical protein
MLNKINWLSIVLSIANYNEKKLGISLMIDKEIMQEVKTMAQRSLNSFNQEKPNIAKIASVISFWIRKLKPISCKIDYNKKQNIQHKVLHINEIIGLMVGLSICAKYIDNFNKENVKLSSRIFNDWVSSLRINSHSPHSTAIAFELLTDNRS